MPAPTPAPRTPTGRSTGAPARPALLLAALAVALAAGCAASPERTARTCVDEGLGWAVGRDADEAVMRRLLAESGTGLIDPIGPKSRVRRDSRPDRLRVFIDAGNVITRVACE